MGDQVKLQTWYGVLAWVLDVPESKGRRAYFEEPLDEIEGYVSRRLAMGQLVRRGWADRVRDAVEADGAWKAAKSVVEAERRSRKRGAPELSPPQ